MLPTLHLTVERWKWNDEWKVWVSTHGRFRDLNKKEIPLRLNKSGYFILWTPDHVPSYVLAHRLVLLTWHPVENADKLTVDHKDSNKRNLHLNNLIWVTQEENLRRAELNQLDIECDEDHASDCSDLSAVVWCGVSFTVQDLCKILFKLFPNGNTEKAHKAIVIQALKKRKTNIFGQKLEYIEKEKRAI